MSASDPIAEFQGEYRWLSNFWPSRFKLDNRWWPDVEHWFQAQKEPTPENAQRILAEPNPAKAKRMGKICVLRPDWNQVKEQVMYQGVAAKFMRRTRFIKETKTDALGRARLVLTVDDAPYDVETVADGYTTRRTVDLVPSASGNVSMTITPTAPPVTV